MKRNPDPSRIALNRYAIISQALARIRAGAERADALRAVAACKHVQLDGSIATVSERSLYRWLSAYEEAGLAGLENIGRGPTVPAALSSAFVDFLRDEKGLDEPASIPELIRRAKELGIVGPKEKVHRSTVYRTCKRIGLRLTRRKGAKERDSRRFAYPHRMDMVLCDGKHFRAGAERKKRLAFFFIDDATRHILHVVVGTTETQELFQRGLYECICKHGFMGIVYMDHGPGFIAADTMTVLAQLDIVLVHGEAGYKEGRGKIERFNRTVKADVLRALEGRPDVDPDCGALALRLLHYADQVYGHRVHESLNGLSPYHRFISDPKPLRFPEDRAGLRKKFEIWIERRVSNDHVVKIGSIDYEVPTGYAGRKVVLRRRLLDGTIGFFHEGKVIDLHPVDLAHNARAKRAKSDPENGEITGMPRRTAADMAFDRDFGKVVDEDGSFDGEEEVCS